MSADAPALFVRTARKADAPAILKILNYYIANSTSIFIDEPQTLEERLAWFDEHSERYPIVAADADGRLVGWGSLSKHNPRPGYSQSADISVYVHPDLHRRGIGRAIVRELIERARAAGHHALLAGCCTEAGASIALHEALGFQRVAHFREVGRKFGRWLDVVYLELILPE